MCSLRPVILKKKPKAGQCQNRYCTRKVKGKVALCNSCSARKGRIENPVRYAYQALKHNARRRGVDFSLTQEEFVKFCEEHGYLQNKGRRAQSMTVDRIDRSKGYSYDNIQPLTLQQNVFKYNYEERGVVTSDEDIIF